MYIQHTIVYSRGYTLLIITAKIQLRFPSMFELSCSRICEFYQLKHEFWQKNSQIHSILIYKRKQNNYCIIKIQKLYISYKQMPQN